LFADTRGCTRDECGPIGGRSRKCHARIVGLDVAVSLGCVPS
jgi:hypothetical protein